MMSVNANQRPVCPVSSTSPQRSSRSPRPSPTSTPTPTYSTARTAPSTCAPSNCGPTTPPTASRRCAAPPTPSTHRRPPGRRSWTTCCPTSRCAPILQRLAGVALLGEVREHILPIFIGTGANGKSTFCKALLHCLGDYGATAEADLFTHRENAHPTGQMDLLGRRFVVVSETDEGKRLAEATMKRLTGGDPITARWMRQNNVTFTPSHLPVLVTNHLPKVSGDDPAIWRRIRVVPWNVAIPDDEQDKTLDAALQPKRTASCPGAWTGCAPTSRTV